MSGLFLFLKKIQKMNYTLFDDKWRNHLLPLTYTRPVSELRLGILTIREKWEKYLNSEIASWKTEEYLSIKYPQIKSETGAFLNGHCCPTPLLAEQVKSLDINQGLRLGDFIIAFKSSVSNISLSEAEEKIDWTEPTKKPFCLQKPWEIFTENANELAADFRLLTAGRKSCPIPSTVNTISPENIFIEERAELNYATINAEKGPVYIGKNAEIMEGSLVRGPFALCDHSVINMGAKIYGATTIGPHSKVGGEINNAVIQGYSNKGHDGFLGNSVLGEWCNLGADTNTSNLKNDYTEVKLWDYPTSRFQKTGLQFCGLIMGDHSKCGINTMFNSGTVIGVACNIHGTGYPRNFVPSFSNGGPQGYAVHPLKMVLATAQKVMDRRKVEFSKADQNILESIFEQTKLSGKY